MEEFLNENKKKVIIALSSLAVVVVAAVVAVVAVFAARQTTVNSGFTISYQAIQVKATISGTYQTNKDTSATALTVTGGGTTITFSGSEATDGTANVKSFTSVTPSLNAGPSDTQCYVDFVYTIVNNHDTDAMDIALANNPDSAEDNLIYTYSATKAGTAVESPKYDHLVSGLAAGATAVITIHVAVANLDLNANAEGSFAFVMTKAA